MFHPVAHYAALAVTRANDLRHDLKMTRIAARGGLTLNELRALRKPEKEAFISKYRDTPENKVEAAE